MCVSVHENTSFICMCVYIHTVMQAVTHHTYACIYTYLHTCMCIYIHTHMHMYTQSCERLHIIHMHVYIHTHTCMYIYIHAHMHMYTYTHICICTYIHTVMRAVATRQHHISALTEEAHTYACVYTYTHICICIYIHTHIQMHIHTQSCERLQQGSTHQRNNSQRRHTHMHVYIHTHTYAYVYTYIHTHICICTYIHTVMRAVATRQHHISATTHRRGTHARHMWKNRP